MSGDDLVNPWPDDLNPPGWKRFIYISETVADLPSCPNPPDLSSDRTGAPFKTNIFPLSTLQIGDRVRIVSLNCGEANNRLMGMGLMPDVTLDVISCTETGSVIVALQDQRLGLGAELAQRIQVMDAQQPLDECLSPATSKIPTMQMTTMQMTSTQMAPAIAPVKLRNAAIGSKLRVIGYEPTARDYKRKLLAMGLTPGTELRVTRHAPLGDPTEIEVRDFHLSLRKDEADALMVETI